MKINYVIATYAGIDTKKIPHTNNPIPSDTLKVHLEMLSKLKQNLSRVTVMKPHCPKELYDEKYYDCLKTTSSHVMDCENFGYSNGQWLKCYENDLSNGDLFDFYIFIEDDYCPYIDNFDKHLHDLYKNKFPSLIGVLCGFVQGYPLQPGHPLPLHYDSAIFVSSQTLAKLYDHYYPSPRLSLAKDLINNRFLSNVGKNPKSIGAYYQVNFSLLFTLIGIEIKDFSQEYIVPYYEKSDNTLYQLISGKESKVTRVHNKITKRTCLDKNRLLIVPIQYTFLD